MCLYLSVLYGVCKGERENWIEQDGIKNEGENKIKIKWNTQRIQILQNPKSWFGSESKGAHILYVSCCVFSPLTCHSPSIPLYLV